MKSFFLTAMQQLSIVKHISIGIRLGCSIGTRTDIQTDTIEILPKIPSPHALIIMLNGSAIATEGYSSVD